MITDLKSVSLIGLASYLADQRRYRVELQTRLDAVDRQIEVVLDEVRSRRTLAYQQMQDEFTKLGF